MKKLLFAAVAAAAMTAICEVTYESSNIVGFNNTDPDGKPCPIVGAQFFRCDGADTFKLQDLAIPGTRNWEDDDGWYWNCDAMNPGGEYIRIFDNTVLKEKAAYTYVSENYIIANLGFEEVENPDISEYKWAIGWWKYESGVKHVNIIKAGKDSEDAVRLQVRTDITFPNGSAFICKFSSNHERKITTQGSVAVSTFAFDPAGNSCPMFANQLPIDIDLNDISIPGTCKWEYDEGWYWNCDAMNPGGEYIRFFDNTVLKEIAAYTYVSANYIIANLGFEEVEKPNISEYEWAIGWWKYESGVKHVNVIKAGRDSAEAVRLQVREPVILPAGYGYICKFSKNHERKIYFPGATSVPSKQK